MQSFLSDGILVTPGDGCVQISFNSTLYPVSAVQNCLRPIPTEYGGDIVDVDTDYLYIGQISCRYLPINLRPTKVQLAVQTLIEQIKSCNTSGS